MQEKREAMKTFLMGGLLPVIIFTFVEEYYGTLWGLVAGMVLGVGEIIYERVKYGRVEGITLAGNAILLVLGGISLLTKEGIWFKLQPALIELAMGGLLLGSWVAGKPFLLLMARKQKILERMPPPFAARFEKGLVGMTVRTAIFFWIHAGLAAYAALYWSTRAWALLKGVGFTGSMLVYMLVEVVFLRRQLRRIA